jgi:mono/diheme cytochrome c family protein
MRVKWSALWTYRWPVDASQHIAEVWEQGCVLMNTDMRAPMPGRRLAALMRRFGLALLLTGAWSGAGQALDPEHQRARALLEDMCARCHAVGETGQSPERLAPPFRSFGEKLYDTDFASRLQEGLTTMHRDMPTFRFNRRDAAAVVNYLKSIQQSKKPH